ncbi:MAG: SDR family oxidoreductase [Anaerolineae bacterium]
MPQNLWNQQELEKNAALDGLVYRSNLLGRDRSIVNIYGGNTSAKLMEVDHLGRAVAVMWIKASGSDVATIREPGFAGLRLAEIMPLLARDALSDDEQIAYLTRCTFAPGRPRQSIETLLHAFIPARHVDHTHPDAIVSLACTPNGPELCRELWGERVVWVPYIRPGFELSKRLAEGVQANPKAELVVMGKHGLTVWGDTSRACYDRTIQTIGEAEEFIAARRNGRRVFGSAALPAVSAEERRQAWLTVLPELRGALSDERPAILQVDDAGRVLEYVGAENVATFSQIGASNPDQLIHNRRVPLLVDWRPSEGGAALVAKSLAGVRRYVADYTATFEAYHAPDDAMVNPNPRVILIPGLGLITTGQDAQAADVSHQLYRRAIEVIDGSLTLGAYEGLTPEEAYHVDAWPLEQYRMSLLKQAARELTGRVAVIAGGAADAVRAVAYRLASDGAHVAIVSDDAPFAAELAEDLRAAFGVRRGLGIACDFDSAEAVEDAFAAVVLAYGGIDIVVADGALSHVAEAAGDTWRRQAMGGSLVYLTDATEGRADFPPAGDLAPVRVNEVRVGVGAPGEDVAEAVAFLAGPRARHITGAALVVAPTSEKAGAHVSA